MDSADVKYSIERVMNPATGRPSLCLPLDRFRWHTRQISVKIKAERAFCAFFDYPDRPELPDYSGGLGADGNETGTGDRPFVFKSLCRMKLQNSSI